MPDVIKPQLLDEESLRAIKKYVDDGDAQAGKVDDVKINNTSIVSSKIANIAVDGTYNSSTNKIATISSITSAINALDVSNITGFGAGKTLATLTETDGKISATFQNISITESQISDFGSYVPTARTIAGLALTGNISSSDLVSALGLSQALTFVGLSTTDPMSTSGATVSGHSTWKKGDVVLYNNLEYVNITGSNTSSTTPNPNWEEFGDAASYALKTTTISAGSGLSGGGDLSTNRTISHATPTGATTTTSGFYKFSTDSFGHVNGTTAVAKADLTGLGVADDSDVVHKGTNSSSVAETIYGEKSFGSTVRFGAYNAGAMGFYSDGSISSNSLTSMNIDAVHSLNLSANGNPGIATSGFNFKDYYKPSGSSTTYTSTYRFPDKTAENKSYVIATTDDLTGFVTGPSSSTANHIAIFSDTTGKVIKDGGLYLTSESGSKVLSTQNSTLVVTGGPTGNDTLGLSIYCSSSGQEVTPASKYNGSNSFSYSYLGTSSKPWTDLYLSGNLSDGTNSTTISALTSHLNNATIHITSAERTAWNGKVSDVRALKVEGATDDDDYYKLQQSKDSGSSYTDVAKTLSYNEAYAILTATA